jgi:hypothetical protein
MDIFELIWLLVIVYFVFRFLFGRAKPQHGNEYEAPDADDAGSDAPTATRDDILEEMRTIFGGSSTSGGYEPEYRPPAQPAPPRQKRVPEPSSHRSDSNKYASYTGTDFIDTAAGAGSDADEALRGVRLESPGLRSGEKPDGGKSFSFLHNTGELRRGIILSEILGKPRAKKRHII